MRGRKNGLCLMVVLVMGLTGCGDPVLEPESMLSGSVDLENCATVRGTVLDASSKSLFLRAEDGNEYVFSLLGATVKVDDRLQAEQQVDVFYELPGTQPLTESNSKQAHVEYICQAED